MRGCSLTFRVSLGATLAAGLITSAVHAELVFKQVRSDKIFYKPGETIKVDAEVANPDGAPASAEVTIDLIHDLDTTIPLGSKSVTVDPGKSQIITLTAKAEPWLGIEARATLKRDGKTLATQSDYCTCAKSIAQVLTVGYGILMAGNVPDDKLDATIKWHTHVSRDVEYGNFVECFAWAPSDYDDLTPDVDRYWAGQTCYNESTSNLKKLLDSLKAQGTQLMTYGKAGGGGLATFEFFRQRPELAMYDEVGRPGFENYDAALLDYLQAIGGPKPGETRGQVGKPEEMEKLGYEGAAWFKPYFKQLIWNAIWYDGNDDRVIQHHGEELAKSAQQLGFDGVRYDGEFFTSRHRLFDGSWNAGSDFNSDASEARMVKNLKSIARKSKPDYLFAYNTHVDFRWNVKADNAPLAFREKCKDNGVIAQEEMAFTGNAPWEDYIKTVRHNSDLVRFYGGQHAAYPFIRNPRVLYSYIVPLALRSHEMFAFAYGTKLPGGDVHIAKFSTRFAGLLWDDGLRGWDAAANEIDVKSSRKIWWQQFAAARPMPAGTGATGGTQFLVHLINAPDNVNTMGDKSPTETDAEKVSAGSMPSSSADDVVVRWKKPQGFKRAMVADLDRCDLQAVEAKTEGNELVLTIPQIKHWSILVIESDAKTPEAVWSITKDEANLKLPTPQELGLTSTTKSSEMPAGQVYVAQAEDCTPGPYGTTDRVTEPDAEGGASAHAQPGRTKSYMVLLPYFFPHVPGKYVAHLRLKVADNTSDKPVVTIEIGHTIEHAKRVAPYCVTKPVTLTGRDFFKPNVYQTFDIPFEHSDVGFRGIGCRYEGNNEVWYDQATVDFVSPWSKEELEHYYAGVVAPTGIKRNVERDIEEGDGPNVVLVRGLWNRMYKLDDAVAKLSKGANVTNSYTSYSIFTDTQFTGFTLDWEPLFKQDVMVLANVESRGIGLGQTKMVQQWVEQGGALVVLGGIVTLGQSYNMERGWSDMLPVELNMPFEIRRCEPAVQFGKIDPSLKIDDASWKSKPPTVFYRHMVKPKDGATVLVAGKKGEPLLVGGKCGKGRVVVFTGTVLGKSSNDNETPFWESPAWPDVLSAAMRWSEGK